MTADKLFLYADLNSSSANRLIIIPKTVIHNFFGSRIQENEVQLHAI
jgi:hypothetical protein